MSNKDKEHSFSFLFLLLSFLGIDSIDINVSVAVSSFQKEPVVSHVRLSVLKIKKADDVNPEEIDWSASTSGRS